MLKSRDNLWDINHGGKREITQIWRGDQAMSDAGGATQDIISYCNFDEDCSTNKCIAYNQAKLGGYSLRERSKDTVYSNLQTNNLPTPTQFFGICAADVGSKCAAINTEDTMATEAGITVDCEPRRTAAGVGYVSDTGEGLAEDSLMPGMFASVASFCDKNPTTKLGNLFGPTKPNKFCKNSCKSINPTTGQAETVSVNGATSDLKKNSTAAKWECTQEI